MNLLYYLELFASSLLQKAANMWTLSGWREQSQACNPRSERRGPTSALPSGIVDLCAHSRRHGECKFCVGARFPASGGWFCRILAARSGLLRSPVSLFPFHALTPRWRLELASRLHTSGPLIARHRAESTFTEPPNAQRIHERKMSSWKQ